MKNGYNPSILQHDHSECYICGKGGDLARHEVFGASNRGRSKELGLWISVCPDCHMYSRVSLHSNKHLSEKVKAIAQRKAMKEYGWTAEDFISLFGRNYL